MKFKNTIIFSLGGSLVYPEKINTVYLKKFQKIISAYVTKGNRAVIVVGGGQIARNFNNAAKTLNTQVSSRELDWMGIKATKTNAELIRIMFGVKAYFKILDKPTETLENEKSVLVSGGWKPGASSDHVAVHLAKRFEGSFVINLTNIDFVYNKDPRTNKDAKKIIQITWSDFRKIVGSKWNPGANLPFDPIASQVAQKEGISVIIMNGNKLSNLQNFLTQKPFIGTVIC
jgi:uridylate kinase